MTRSVQYITDANGERTAVILPLEEYEEMLEDLHVTRVAEETKDDERIPWKEVKAELISEGKLDEAYSVALRSRASRETRRLDRQTLARISKALDTLGDNPRPPGCLKVKNTKDFRAFV